MPKRKNRGRPGCPSQDRDAHFFQYRKCFQPVPGNLPGLKKVQTRKRKGGNATEANKAKEGGDVRVSAGTLRGVSRKKMLVIHRTGLLVLIAISLFMQTKFTKT